MANIPVYIRYGEIPKDGKSKIYFGNEPVGQEPGISVWETYKINNIYFPKLPDNPTENAIEDYFDNFLHKDKDKKVYLVTGNIINCKGHNGEPLLENVVKIRELKYLE